MPSSKIGSRVTTFHPSLLLYAYIFFASWTNIGFGGVLRVHVLVGVFSILSFLTVLFVKKSSFSNVRLVYRKEDLWLLFGVIGVIISAIINPGPKSINYIAGYFYVFILAYLVLKGLFFVSTDFRKVLLVNLFAVLFIACFSITEFSLKFLFDYNILSLIPRIRTETSLYGGMFPRTYAFAAEPGVLALYFETLGILAIWSTFKYISNSWKRYLFFIIIFLGWFFTFSAGSVVAVAIGILVTGIGNLLKFLIKKTNHIKRNSLIVASVLLIVLIIVLSYPGLLHLQPLYNKISNVGSSTRMQHWEKGINSFLETPLFGKGIGNISAAQGGSFISWYLFLAAEGGIISILPFILFLVFSTTRIFNSNLPGTNWFLVASLAGTAHFAIISTFFRPFLWLVLLVFNIYEGKYIGNTNSEKLN